MAHKVILLDFWSSLLGMRVRIALAEKDIKYEYKEENLRDKSPLLLQMNPVHKKIPVLIHNGKPVCESLIVFQYIEEVWSGKSPLFPSDPYLRAESRFWADFIDKKLYDPERKIYTTKGEQEAAKKEFIDCLKLLEKELGDKPYFGSENFGFLNIALVTSIAGSMQMKRAATSIEAEYPKLIRWGKGCMGKKSVYKSLADPHKVLDLVSEERKMFGIEERKKHRHERMSIEYQAADGYGLSIIVTSMHFV